MLKRERWKIEKGGQVFNFEFVTRTSNPIGIISQTFVLFSQVLTEILWFLYYLFDRISWDKEYFLHNQEGNPNFP